MAKRKRYIRNYLLDRRYQLHFTVVMVLLGAVLTAALGYFWYDEMRKASRVVEVEAVATLPEAEVAQLKKDLAQRDNIRLGQLIGFWCLFTAILTGYGIVLTHKVAGPLYKIGCHMADVEEGRLYPVWDVRKKDHLQEFWKLFKAMHEALRERASEEARTLTATINLLNDPEARNDQAAVQKQIAALASIKDRKVRSLAAKPKTLEQPKAKGPDPHVITDDESGESSDESPAA